MFNENFWVDYEDMMRKQKERLFMERADILRTLRSVGITQIEGRYDAYGDSGNVEDITITPEEISASNHMGERLKDFVWRVAYGEHPGFENNDGGFGELTWDVVADSITLDHGNRFTDVNYSYQEGL